MTNNKRSSLRGLSLEDLRNTCTTSTLPAQLVQERSWSGHKFFLDSPRTSGSLAFAQSSLSPIHSNHAIYTVTPTTPGNFTIPTARSPSSQLADSASQFGFSYPTNVAMPREQEPARNPLRPSQANAQPSQRTMDKPSSQRPASPVFSMPITIPDDLSSPQPMFGKTTALGASPQPFARQPPLQRPVNVGMQKQSDNRNDAYSNLFITAKSSATRPDLHKPAPGSNPLSQLHKPPGSSNPLRPSGTTQPGSRMINRDDDDVFEIPKPANFPSWQPKPISYPTFSSQQPTSTHYKPSNNFSSAALLDIGMSTNTGPWSEQYNSSDPYEFMDTVKANEQLKALFEGSVEDEEDKPKTRKRKKQLEAKMDDLADQVKKLQVKADGSSPATEVDPEEEEDEDDGTVEGLKVKLLPHQIEGVEWMRSKELGNKNGRGKTMGGILADDMGLGKTIQSIVLILTNPKPVSEDARTERQKDAIKSDKGTLVVAPLALIKQWEAEIKDRVETDHALKVCVHHGPKRTKSYKDLRKYDVVITTYSTLTSEHAASSDELPVGCYGLKWYRIILDEAHSIKNRNAKSTKAACALNSRYKWCLTGTPMQNNLDELQSLIHFLRISPMDKLDYWRDFITRPMNGGRGGLAIKRLQAVLRNIMKRRTKDVLKLNGALKNGKKDENGNATSEFKIVKRTVENVEAEFTKQERSFYERLESRTDQRLEVMMAGNKMSYASALVLLMRLRQACNHPRLIGSDLAADKDALIENGSQTPKKKQITDDTDDLAALLGGLTVEMKLCDVCQVELGKDEVKDGALRCDDCEQDIQEQEKLAKTKRNKKETLAMVKNDRKVKRRVILDSDDEDDEDTKPKAVNLSPYNRAETDDSNEDDDDDEQEESDESEYDSSEESPSDIIASTKIRHLLSILRNDAHTHKYIVFSVFTSMLDLIEPFLRQSHIKFVRYDGSMRNDMREASLHNLKTDPTVRVLLCSLRAGSLGLNLTAASRVVVLEPFWNPFVEEQAIDRVHRLNQTQDVIVYKMTIKDTVEARILDLQEKKRALAKATVEGGKGSAVAKLSMTEMLKLFDHRAERDAKVDMLGMKDSRGLLEQGTERIDDDDDVVVRGSRGGGYGVGGGDQRRRESDRERKRDVGSTKERPKVPDVYARRW